MSCQLRILGLVSLLGLTCLFVALPVAQSQDGIMGQIQFVQTTKVTKSSGVWVDGQYVGYLGELQGRNRLRLLPGVHEILVRQAGYEDFDKKFMIEPGKILDVRAQMERDTRFQFPDAKTSAEVRLDVKPDRAAVFLDDNFVGHVNEFYGMGNAMLVMPGKHTIKIGLGGYKVFETQVTLLPHQKFRLKTELVEGSINDADPLIKSDRSASVRANSSESQAKN
jgi:hypothetical protein